MRGSRHTRKTIFTVSFPVTFPFDLYTLNVLPLYLLLSSAVFKTFLGLSYFEKIGGTGRSDRQRDRRTGCNA